MYVPAVRSDLALLAFATTLAACVDPARTDPLPADTGAPVADPSPHAGRPYTPPSALVPAADTGEVGDTADTGFPCGDEEPDPVVALENVIDGAPTACELAWYLARLDERGAGAGPWFEDLFVTWSQDSRYFDPDAATLIRTHAAVPDAIRGPDGRVYLFYGEGDLDVGRAVATSGSTWFGTHGLVGYGALQLAVSDDGYTFETVEEFEVEEIVRGMVVDPDVVRLPDGRYRLYYVGSSVPEMLAPGAWDDGMPHRLFYAESDDLIHWTQVGEAVEGPNADPTVYCLDTTSCMVASTGLDWSYSSDGGATFAFESRGDPWGFAPELLDLGDGVVRLYYNSKHPGGAVLSALSTDGGSTWLEEGERVEARKAEALSVIADADVGWLVYFHYWQDGYDGDTWNDDTGDTGAPDTGAPDTAAP